MENFKETTKGRFETRLYESGSSLSEQWDDLYDGEWPYHKDCYEVIFKMKGESPLEIFVNKD